MQTDNSNVVGSYQYDLARGLNPGTSSSYDVNQNTGQISIPNASPISPTIQANNIGATSPMNLPSVPQNTTAQGVISSTVQGATTSQNQIQQAQQNVQDIQLAQGPSQADQAQQNIINAARQAMGAENQINQSQANAEAQAVNPQQEYLNNINNEIAKENASYLGQQHQVFNTPLTAGQARSANDAIATEHAYRMAPLAIQQAAAQGNIQAIQSNFDRQTKLLIQPYENELKFQQTFAQKYADTLTNKESKQLDMVMNERKDLIQQTKDLQQAKANMIAEISKNGGGTDQATIQAVQNATDVTGIAQAGSKYIGQMDFLKSQADIAQSRASAAASYAQRDKLNAETKDIIAKNTENTAPAILAMRQATAQSNISTVDSLVKDPAIMGAVGTNFLSRGFFGGSTPYRATGEEQNFIAGVEQLRSQLSLDALIKAKAQGATFGALSDTELAILSQSASKLGKWAIVKDGSTVGYNASEKDFKTELDKINNFSKLDYVLKGGTPSDVGVQVGNNGKMYVKNWDGSVTQLN